MDHHKHHSDTHHDHSAEHSHAEHHSTHPHAKSESPWQNPMVIAALIIAVGLIIGGGLFFLANQKGPANVVDQNKIVDGNRVVEVIEFSDFQCPVCENAFPIVQQIKQEYAGRINFTYKQFPLQQIHPLAQKAAEASECAKVQGKFEAYHDSLFQNYREWAVNAQGYPLEDVTAAVALFKKYAQTIGLNTTTFDTCLDTGASAATVEAQYQEGIQKNVGGTPTFFVNGKEITPGRVPTLAEFKQEIDNALIGAPQVPLKTINFTLIEDVKCVTCNDSVKNNIIAKLTQAEQQVGFKVNVITIPSDSAQAQEIIGKISAPYLPQLIADSTIKETPNYNQIAEIFPEKNGVVYTELDSLAGAFQTYIIKNWFEAPAIGTSPVSGDQNSSITVIEFSDFQCPFCKRAFENTTSKLLSDQYKGRVKLVYKHSPLDTTCNPNMSQQLHPFACAAANASECAKEQSKFFEFHNLLFNNWTDNQGNSPDWSRSEADANRIFNQYAADLNLNTAQFSQCVTTKKFGGLVDADILQAQQYGVNGTPNFFIDTVQIPGAFPIETFEQIFKELGK